MIAIDGSFGEGGGQVLRSSLALSLVTGQPFSISNIRGNRKKPGLRQQHLTAVNAAARFASARVTGNSIGSLQLQFIPQNISAGNYSFTIGTAGSTTLVLQTVLPALMIADQPSELILEGGTHNPFAPSYDFLSRVFLPIINQMGPGLSASIERIGFFPAGGGRLRITIIPSKELKQINLYERGTLKVLKAEVLLSKLPESIGHRERTILLDRLNLDKSNIEIIQVDSPGPGNVVTIGALFQKISELFIGFGRKGIPAEKVAAKTARQALAYLDCSAPVGIYLADQLILPMAIAGGGSFRTMKPSLHTLTNIDIVKKFIDIHVSIEPLEENLFQIDFSV